MSDREGVPPEGGAPSRPPEPPREAQPQRRPQPPTPSPPPRPSGDDAIPPIEGDVAIVAPAEPTLRAEPAVREYDVPFDTGELRSLPTGQLLVVHRAELGEPVEAVDEDDEQRRVFSWISAVLGIIGAAASLFLGWLLPLSIAAIVFGVLGLRREEEGRTLAFIGIGTGIAGLVFSSVWIGYYAIVFGALPR